MSSRDQFEILNSFTRVLLVGGLSRPDLVLVLGGHLYFTYHFLSGLVTCAISCQCSA